MKIGIDAISFYVPKLYVSMETLAEARGIPVEKLQRGLGLQNMAFPNHGEDAATFAANALLNLIQQNNIDPNSIGRVYLGTESAIDGSKPTATYAVEIVENALAQSYGERCFKNCDILDMTFACVGGVDALHNSLDWVKQDPTRKAVVIASDLSKYDINSTGEYTQGAGAVAVLVSHEPSIMAISDTWGVASKSEGDFFKPRRSYRKSELLKAVFEDLNLDASEAQIKAFIERTDSEFWSDNNEIIEVFKEEPVFDGQFSNACYEDRITEALGHFNSQTSVDFLNDWQQIVFHLPYAFHGRRIIFNNWLQWIKSTPVYQELEAEIGTYDEEIKKDWLKRAYKSQLYIEFVSTRIKSGELASSDIGNMYTASIFMALLSYLSESFKKNANIEGNKVGLIAYGSGSKSKVFEGTIQPSWASKVEGIQLFEYLENRTPIDLETYENLHRSKLDQPVHDGSKISLDYIERDEFNYGLRRYSIK
ncbi:hydroxymethylglutaryl-CoA synthase family protein [Psychroserpens sp.]|uniref:hydroxymethylglutaryl-CoA synthase family protein n=1 Tax=Psychroserpens sp. TaxID=2020870 RepID=UPI001B05AEBB|nr:hydroxymethylglutaryl-CoA synthase [Psychroserpens sp.]MBO6605209.1 hydroxymethylglutaryl-CoA synthase [Psychroserpens sp.]MBO6630157.1 hydroxymethylglutaryl-CoA synthase [Psychroserpens sp.]MBO6653982.1 hydroxymethylglutaryl-CoA synthase [Psychroserpens sp.]MBO6682303.1 hydroxymethylglutaryl-CoA synthase [Psychroserpens sp.]MBO6748583.1 hydroxymethylglutaryl-CoA synthase [Psychroserpens sp.]